MQMRLCRCDMGVVTLKEKVLLDDLTGIRMEGSGGLHIVADGEVKQRIQSRTGGEGYILSGMGACGSEPSVKPLPGRAGTEKL